MKAVFARVLMVALMAPPAMAQGWIDYDLLMQENAARVVTETAADGAVIRTLDMGDGVVVVCDAQGCTGMDTGPQGAAGCTFAIVSSLRDAIVACPALGTAAQQARIMDLYASIGAFVAANAVPPRSWDGLRRMMEDASAPGIGRMRGQCAAVTAGNSDVAMMLGALAGSTDDALDPATWAPRLPVMNPCL
jgi:hypothetical protein